MQSKTVRRWNCRAISILTRDSTAAQAKSCCLEHRRSRQTPGIFFLFSQPDFQCFSGLHMSIFLVFSLLDRCHSYFLFLFHFLYLFASFCYLSGSVIHRHMIPQISNSTLHTTSDKSCLFSLACFYSVFSPLI